MMSKTIKLEEIKVVTVPPSVQHTSFVPFDFPIRSKFILENVLYTVVKISKDGNTEWRGVISAANAEQDYMLSTLQKDAAKDPGFVIVDDPTKPVETKPAETPKAKPKKAKKAKKPRKKGKRK